MSSYLGYHAELYDLFYNKKPYKKESSFVHYCLKSYSSFPVKHILDLACGTGNHAIHLANYGYCITAADYSKDMLNVAKKKIVGFPNVNVIYMDMRKFNKSGRTFDSILCLFDSIGYVNTNENILKVLKNIHQNIRKNGLFIFEFWNAGAMLCSYEPVRVKIWKTNAGKIVRKSETRIRYSEQLADVSYTISVYDKNDKLVQTIRETQTNRYFLVQEMNAFLSFSDFEVIKWFDGYSKKEVNKNSWHILCIARRK